MEKPPKTKWTIMAYLAGDNDLTPFCINVLQQLEAVKYRDDVCVLACFDSNTPWPKGSRYFTINCSHRLHDGDFNWQIHNDLVSPNGNRPVKATNFFDPDYKTRNKPFERPVVAEGLKRFIDWAVDKHADSENFMLVLFGHGPIVAGQSFLMAANPPSYLQMSDLKEVLDPHFGPNRKLDILAFQNCAMNGIEMAWEIRNYVDVMIGSQGLVLANGWPYEEIISAIVKRPDDKPLQVAQMMLKTCARNLLDFAIMGRSSEQSACDIEYLREKSQITDKLRALVKALEEGLEFEKEEEKGQKKKQDEANIKKLELAYPAICDAITLARLEAQSYFGELYVDLFDFCERLIKKCDRIFLDHQRLLRELKLLDETSHAGLRNSELIRRTLNIIKCCLDVRMELENLVKKDYSYYIGSQLQYSRGLSIYFPWTLPSGPYFPRPKRSRKDYRLNTPWDTYNTYSFVKQSNWTDFLNAFFKATLRGVRRNDCEITLNDNPDPGEGLTEENQPQYHPLPGLIKMDYPSMDSNLVVPHLQKSSPDTGGVDSDLWSSIKNYPRQDYLSPADTRRADRVRKSTTKEATLQMRKDEKNSPLVLPLGWNITGLVKEVIQKKSSKTQQSRKRVSAKALTKAASS